AVTAWALMGARDWSSLAVENSGDFECGAFDPRSGQARTTGVAKTMAALGHDKTLPPAAQGLGWWRRPERLHYPSAAIARRATISAAFDNRHTGPLLIAGASGTLGQALLRSARARGIYAIATSRQMMALDDRGAVTAALDHFRPWAVLNATGWVRVDAAEVEPEACYKSNVAAALNLAVACETRGIPNVHFSSDLVFDGDHPTAYHESDPTAPLSVYGASKAQADAMLQNFEKALIIRTAAFFSPYDPYNFAAAIVRTLREGHRFAASDNHYVSPTYVPHLAQASLDLLIDEATGLWHVSNGVELSWHDFGREIAGACGLDPTLVIHSDPDALGWIASRPPRCGLVSQKGQIIPALDKAIGQFRDLARV
ncbi:MAG: SDR family oxidoreductase, partial [Sphingorhabdus sp.]